MALFRAHNVAYFVTFMAGLVGVTDGHKPAWFIMGAVLVVLVTEAVSHARPTCAARCLQWVIQPSFTTLVVLFGYPLAEVINNPEDDLKTNLMVSLGLALIAPAIARYRLSRQVDAQLEERFGAIEKQIG